jgi:acylphosphatase
VGETISGDGVVLPYLVICAGQVHLEGWVYNNLDGDILMAVLDTGYSNDELALEWLKHFERFSAKR